MPYYRCGMRDPLVFPQNLYPAASNVFPYMASCHKVLAIIHINGEHGATAQYLGAIYHP